MTTLLGSLNILDFSTLLPGPYATMILADLGANVVRVEAPGRDDLTRSTPPFENGVAASHAFLNRSKRSLGLDLKQPQAANVIKRLVQTHDIVVEQFRPGVMDRLGVGYAALQAVNPNLIYCSLTGYGQTGPYADRAGHDLNYLALSGILSAAGRAGTTPAPFPVQLADVGAGSLFLIAGLLAAFIRRTELGQGGHVDISMFDGSLAWNWRGITDIVIGETIPQPESMMLNGGTFYDCYPTSDGRFLSVASLEPKFWAGFCQTIGRPDLIVRGAHLSDGVTQQAVKAEIASMIVQKTLDAWIAIFAKTDVCVEPVLNTYEALAHPQTQARNMLAGVPRPDGSLQPQVANPIKVTDFAPVYTHVGTELGAHSLDVLSEVGYSAQEIEELRANHVIVSPIQVPRSSAAIAETL